MTSTKARSTTLRAASLVATLVLVPALLGAAVIPTSQLQRALRKQQRQIADKPQDATLWNDLGNLLLLAERPREAEEAYRRGLEIDPDLVTARYNLALLYQEMGRPGRSKRALHRILRHHPDHAWARYYLGVAHAEAGHRKLAIREFARAIVLDPDLTDPTFNPHVYDNELLAQAALRAYADAQGAELAPRLYEDREGVVRSMVRPRRLENALMGNTDEPAPMIDLEPEPEPGPGDAPEAEDGGDGSGEPETPRRRGRGRGRDGG